MSYYNTKTFEISYKIYCSYCGKKALSKEEWLDHRPYADYYFCDCEAAKLEIEMQKEINELKREYNEKEWRIKERYKKLLETDTKEFEYEIKLKSLNEQYNK